MAKLAKTFYEGSTILKCTLAVLVGAVYLGMSVFSGGSLVEMVLLAAMMLFYVWLPGRFWTAVLKTDSRFRNSSAPMSILFGTGFFCFLYCISIRLSVKRMLLIVPPVLGCTYLYKVIRQKKLSIKMDLSPDAWMLIMLFSALLFLSVWTMVVKNALPSKVGVTLINQDLLWNVGNAESFKIRFIPEDIRYSGVQLHYHYLTEMFAGALSWISGISAYRILAFYIYPYILSALIISLYSFGMVWYGQKKKSMLFTYSMFLFGCRSLWMCLGSGRSLFYNDLTRHLITNINSQGTAFIFLCAYGIVFLQLIEKRFDVDLLSILIWLVSFFVLIFSKGPLSAIVAIGSVITVLWLFMQKKANLKGMVSAIVLWAGFMAVYTLFFASGAATSMPFSFSGTLSRTIFLPIVDRLFPYGPRNEHILACLAMMVRHSFLMAPLQFFLYCLGLVSDVKNLFRLNGARLWANSLVVGGLLAFYLFNHYAMSQVYFAFLSIFFLHLLSIDALDGIEDKKILKYAAVALRTVCFVTQGFMYINFCGSGLRVFLKNTGLQEKYIYRVMINEDDEAAMDYLREHTDSTALFATNRVNSLDISQDGVSNIYSALSGRQGYMEGYTYALTNMGVPYYVVSQRRAVNRTLFSEDADSAQLRDIVSKTGITHLIYSGQFPGSTDVLDSTFELVYDSPTVRIYQTGVRPVYPHPLYQEELSEYVFDQ